ncbi:hypothetical protein C8R46DRAFT_426406 [Mycena filopes]|nr:hypothetical protein C8R46DRAFT_426406 [Mycena filopes]
MEETPRTQYWAIISPDAQYSVAYLESAWATSAAAKLKCGQYLALIEPPTMDTAKASWRSLCNPPSIHCLRHISPSSPVGWGRANHWCRILTGRSQTAWLIQATDLFLTPSSPMPTFPLEGLSPRIHLACSVPPRTPTTQNKHRYRFRSVRSVGGQSARPPVWRMTIRGGLPSVSKAPLPTRGQVNLRLLLQSVLRSTTISSLWASYSHLVNVWMRSRALKDCAHTFHGKILTGR